MAVLATSPVSPEALLPGELSSASETERLYRGKRLNGWIRYSIHLFPQKSVTRSQNCTLFIRGRVCYTESTEFDPGSTEHVQAAFAFITTGGTIASVRTAQGLRPVLTSEELLAHLPELNELCCPETLALCSIDSTDLGPEHWLLMARAVQENYALYDGFIICHGTDTLAYSAAALSYLIQNADKPIILTGAQQPISNEITDAKKNLRDSVICALDPAAGA